MTEFFKDVTGRIPYEGPDGDDPLAFHWYDADRVVAGKAWRTTCASPSAIGNSSTGTGSHLRRRNVGIGRGATLVPGDRPMDAARQKMAAAFEFFDKLGVPSTASTTRTSRQGGDVQGIVARLDEMVDLAAEHQSARAWACCGPANMFSNPRYQAGAATNPDPEVFAYAAAQVTHAWRRRPASEATTTCCGRPRGHDTLLNTDLRRELDQLARFLSMVWSTSNASGFNGGILLEPKPFEPTSTSTEFDVAAVHAFLQRYDLADEIKVNIEVTTHAVGPRLRHRSRSRSRRDLGFDRRQRRRRPIGWTSTASRCRSSRWPSGCSRS